MQITYGESVASEAPWRTGMAHKCSQGIPSELALRYTMHTTLKYERNRLQVSHNICEFHALIVTVLLVKLTSAQKKGAQELKTDHDGL